MFVSLKTLKTKLFRKNESQLLEQEFMTFETTLLKIKAGQEKTKEFPGIIEAIETLLQGEKSRRNANRIEQLMIPLLSDAEVSNELEKKLFQLKRYSDKTIYSHYVSKVKEANRSEKTVLLTDIIKELQRCHEEQLVRLDYAKVARTKTGLLFAISFILFILPKFTDILFSNIVVEAPEGTRNYYILTALLSGWMGGTFSMLLGLRKRIGNTPLDQLHITYRSVSIIGRAIIGMFAGLLFFYFFESGMLSGALLPEFSNGHLDKANFALLVIWCVIAGFSEKMVPDILSKSENLDAGKSNLQTKSF
ncbi:MAG: hypothetical protein GY940_41485 [bacterium]|nr:hypothetical protein [bacterium]